MGKAWTGGSPTFLCVDHFTNRAEEGEEKPYSHPNIPTSGSPRKKEKQSLSQTKDNNQKEMSHLYCET